MEAGHQMRAFAAAGMVAAASPSGASAQTWTQFGGGPARRSLTDSPLPALDAPAWIASTDTQGRQVQFLGQSGVVCDTQHVYAPGFVEGQARLLAFRRDNGACAWGAPAEAPYLSSWATPAVDAGHGTVLVAAGKALRAYDAATGADVWRADLDRHVVNASPLVTHDRGTRNRAFITDYDGFGNQARLYAVNIDPYDAGANPYQPGQIAWSAPIGSAAGATPAYAEGRVYVATAGAGGVGPGRILAFDADAGQDAPPLWMFTNVKGASFHGGVCIDNGHIYAASYAYTGGRFSANLVKVNAANGALVWSVSSNRTDATPVVAGGLVVISTGIAGFGSLPAVQVFRDLGASAALEWDSAQATWTDSDGDGQIDDGEYLPIGGWTHQPLVSTAGGERTLLIGAIPTAGEDYAPCTDLYAIDLEVEGGAPGWIIGHHAGAGSTPAAAGGRVYTIGAGGLAAFGACAADCDGSGALDLFDFLCFQNSFANQQADGDCDGDGSWTIFDFLCFQNLFAGGC